MRFKFLFASFSFSWHRLLRRTLQGFGSLLSNPPRFLIAYSFLQFAPPGRGGCCKLENFFTLLNNLCYENTNRIAICFSKAALIILAIKRLLHPLLGGAKEFSLKKFFKGVGLIKRKLIAIGFEMPPVFAFFVTAIG